MFLVQALVSLEWPMDLEVVKQYVPFTYLFSLFSGSFKNIFENKYIIMISNISFSVYIINFLIWPFTGTTTENVYHYNQFLMVSMTLSKLLIFINWSMKCLHVFIKKVINDNVSIVRVSNDTNNFLKNEKSAKLKRMMIFVLIMSTNQTINQKYYQDITKLKTKAIRSRWDLWKDFAPAQYTLRNVFFCWLGNSIQTHNGA